MYVSEPGTANNFGSYYGETFPVPSSNSSSVSDFNDLGLLPDLWETSSTESVDREVRFRHSPLSKQPPVSTQPMFHMPGSASVWSTPASTPQPPVNMLDEARPRPHINPKQIYTYNYYGTIFQTGDDRSEESLRLASLAQPMPRPQPPSFPTLLGSSSIGSASATMVAAPPHHPPAMAPASAASVAPAATPANNIGNNNHATTTTTNGGQGSQGKPTLNTQLYKTELCAQYMKLGGCPYGNKCQFAHGEGELKQVERPPKWRSKPCANWSKTGSCRYGNRCSFKHG
ncbi:hypothetical protein DIURU_003791 [Diutina rugosa]|uniref:C3H1-type domain-containing protein n=1 Tax=Diutina rugosa TaxID=5481 RepID=A0A642UJZ0_DIURU|nr:uncharacterized protein DIURU_003791 [Diutina rugosa]KAA8900368.1 hypothetical protein DIURU_003791 [Diutina rugosa]